MSGAPDSDDFSLRRRGTASRSWCLQQEAGSDTDCADSLSATNLMILHIIVRLKARLEPRRSLMRVGSPSKKVEERSKSECSPTAVDLGPDEADDDAPRRQPLKAWEELEPRAVHAAVGNDEAKKKAAQEADCEECA